MTTSLACSVPNPIYPCKIPAAYMPRNWGAVDFVDFVDFMDFMDFMRQTATAPTVVYQSTCLVMLV